MPKNPTECSALRLLCPAVCIMCVCCFALATLGQCHAASAPCRVWQCVCPLRFAQCGHTHRHPLSSVCQQWSPIGFFALATLGHHHAACAPCRGMRCLRLFRYAQCSRKHRMPLSLVCRLVWRRFFLALATLGHHHAACASCRGLQCLRLFRCAQCSRKHRMPLSLVCRLVWRRFFLTVTLWELVVSCSMLRRPFGATPYPRPRLPRADPLCRFQLCRILRLDASGQALHPRSPTPFHAVGACSAVLVRTSLVRRLRQFLIITRRMLFRHNSALICCLLHCPCG